MFSLNNKNDFVWLLENSKPFGFYCKSQKLFNFFRFSPDDPTNFYSKPQVIENFHFGSAFGVITSLRSDNIPVNSFEPLWELCNSKIEFTLEEKSIHAINLYTVKIEKLSTDGAFIITFKGVYKRNREKIIEAFNVYVGGLEVDNKDFARGTRHVWTIWNSLNGLRCHPNSHPFTYLSNPVARGKYLHPENGWIGFGVSEKYNPIWYVKNCSPRMSMVTTCDMFFDQHLTIDAPGLENRDQDGWYVSDTEVILINHTQNEMNDLLKDSKPVSSAPVPVVSRNAVHIIVNEYTKTNKLVDRSTLATNPLAIFPSWYPQSKSLSFKPLPEQNGESYLCLDGKLSGPSEFHYWEPRPTFPSNCKVTFIIKGYCLQIDNKIEVGICTTMYNHFDIMTVKQAEPITQDGFFEREVTIENGIFNFVSPYIVNTGSGTVWIMEIGLVSY